MECLPPGGEDSQAWTGGEEVREVWSSREHPLAVVEEEQQALCREEAGHRLQQRLSGLLTRPEHGGDAGNDERRIVQRGEVDEDNPIWKVLQHALGDRDRQPRLADSAGTGHRQQPDLVILELASERRELSLTPDEPGQRPRQ